MKKIVLCIIASTVIIHTDTINSKESTFDTILRTLKELFSKKKSTTIADISPAEPVNTKASAAPTAKPAAPGEQPAHPKNNTKPAGDKLSAVQEPHIQDPVRVEVINRLPGTTGDSIVSLYVEGIGGRSTVMQNSSTVIEIGKKANGTYRALEIVHGFGVKIQKPYIPSGTHKNVTIIVYETNNNNKRYAKFYQEEGLTIDQMMEKIKSNG